MITTLGYAIGLIGGWIFSDGVLSILLYLHGNSYNGCKQTWKFDHSIRIVRCLAGIALIWLGVYA